MPRIARIYTEEGIFHVLTRGNNKQNIFKEAADFKVYLHILKELKRDQPFRLYNYCLMSNHVHLILESNKSTELSKFMKRLNLTYYHYYKRKHGYAGHFWQDRFKSLLIARDEYLLACGLYIERNPVRAGIAQTPQEYPYSSYGYYGYGREDVLLDENLCYQGLGNDPRSRQSAYRKLIADKQMNITSSTFNQLFLGSVNFIQQMEQKFNIKNVRLIRGRPKKTNK